MEPVIVQKPACGLENFVSDGPKYTEMERDWTAEREATTGDSIEIYYDPMIKVVGIGGGCTHTINRFHKLGFDIETVIDDSLRVVNDKGR